MMWAGTLVSKYNERYTPDHNISNVHIVYKIKLNIQIYIWPKVIKLNSTNLSTLVIYTIILLDRLPAKSHANQTNYNCSFSMFLHFLSIKKINLRQSGKISFQ